MSLIGILRKAPSITTSLGVATRHLLVVAAVAVAVAVRLALNPVLDEHSPYLPFTLAVLVAARFGGRSAGFLATALSAVSVLWFFIEPVYSFAFANPAAGWGIALFILVSSLISLLAGHLQEVLLSTARSEAMLRRQNQLIELSHDAVITMDSDRRIVTWNAGAEQVYGWSEAEAKGKVVYHLLKTSSGMPAAQIDDTLRRDGRWNGELRQVTRDGRLLIVDSRQVAVRANGNQPARILEINRDVTENRRAAEALRESEERIRSAQEIAHIGTFEWNIETGVNRWTPELEALYGLPPGGFNGTQEAWEELIHPDDRAAAVQRVQQAFATGEPTEGEWRVVTPDGNVRWLAGRWQVFKDAAGIPLRMKGVNIDISDRKRAEEALRLASEQRRLALESAHMGAWEHHIATGQFLLDHQSQEIWGPWPDGKPSYDQVVARVHPDDRAGMESAFQQALAGTNGGAFHHELRILRPGGSPTWVASHGCVFFEGEGSQRRPARVVGVTMEVTDRVLAEERLRQTQKLESIGLLAGGVAHDFNNLLTVIMGSASAALEECPTCQHSQAVLGASERAAHLTKQLLAYAGKGQVVTKVFDVTELVARTRPLLSASIPKRVSLSFNLSENLPPLEADPIRVEQILMNLVINAGEAIPPKTDGRIDIGTSHCDVTPGLAREHSQAFEIQTGPHVCLEVTDNGDGMDEATISRIFDPFFSTKFTGRGLGLAAVYGIVRSSKGFIEVHSHPGKGSTFRVFLPATTKKRNAAEQPERKSNMVREYGKPAPILVVDDEEMVRKLACLMLRQHGYETLQATDGKDALRVLEESAIPPSVILLDLAMPVMGGDELVPILEKHYPALKVIVTSGYPEEDARKGLTASAVAAFLQKPYTAVALKEKIREVLDCGPGPRSRIIEFPKTG